MTTRAQRETYINSLRLTENQKSRFKRTNLNKNTIQKVVNTLSGKSERNARINGILRALLNDKNRGPLNSLLRQSNNSVVARNQNTPTSTPTSRNNQNTPTSTPTSRNNQNTPTSTSRNVRPINNTNRNALKR